MHWKCGTPKYAPHDFLYKTWILGPIEAFFLHVECGNCLTQLHAAMALALPGVVNISSSAKAANKTSHVPLCLDVSCILWSLWEKHDIVKLREKKGTLQDS